MHWLYAVTLALAAFLLFWAELLFGRLLLPRFGGTPAVWATCLLFFQATLLLGYGLCRLTARWAGKKRQVIGALGLLLAAGLVLPLAVTPAQFPEPGSSRVSEIFYVLALALGLPFLAVSIFAPLLQAWYGLLGRAGSTDPYFLYAASNAGSLLALVLYPFVIEPRVSLSTQGQLWAAGFGALAFALFACAFVVRRARTVTVPAGPTPLDSTPPSDRTTKLRWVWLALLPASLLYGVTTAITTDIAPLPLLWAAPLAIYLASFVLAFARRRLLPFEFLRALVPVVVTAVIVSTLFGNRGPLGVVLALHLGGFAVVACVLHRDLASLRPTSVAPGRLEGYYLWIAVGGLLGGVAAVLAPLVLHTAIEYPWALVLAGLVVASVPQAERASGTPRTTPAPVTEGEALELLAELQAETSAAVAESPSYRRFGRAAVAFAAGVLTCILLSGFSGRFFTRNLPGYLLALIVVALIARSFKIGRLKAAAGYVFVVLIGQCALGPLADSVFVERSFFGVQRVVNDQARSLHTLHHGTTVHGRQSYAPGIRRTPLAYFGREGPAGQVFDALARGDRVSRVGVIGLGVGSLAAYASPGQVWEFFEIDPLVARIARDPALFSFLADAPIPITVTLGDARLSLAASDESVFDLLVLDAFSSDAIPVHLLTQEAFDLYFNRLTSRGLLLANVSNRFLDLEAVFAAHVHERGLVGRIRRDLEVSPAAQQAGLTPSVWILVGRSLPDLAIVAADPRWTELRGNGSQLWTDDHADVLGALRSGR
ncbi:MAG: fused MFS/spermidine synthase [Planctomycetes bacterium]|nr:fused MFS/spermidine synthase [Planctomycetota bacterium]